jgi:AhpD family alkylhydroperoxidase
MNRFFIFILALVFFGISNIFAKSEATATYKDIKQTLGIIPTMFRDYPEEGITGAWNDMKGLELNANSAIPGKYKELISLAVAAQIPCRSCVYFHKQFAKLYNATAKEIGETLAMAGGTRKWSAFLTGVQMDVGEFRSEIDKMLMFQNKHSNLQAMEVEPAPAEMAIKSAGDVYKDAKIQMGFVPNFITQYPQSSIVGAWGEMKGIEMNPDTAVPGKYKELIGLAVAAQIPCQYCVYYHTQSAIMQGATKEELQETAALAGSTRAWSTIINGLMIEDMQFRHEVDQIVKFLKTKKEVVLSH